MNLNLYNSYDVSDFVWLDRGIKLALIYNILKYYKLLIDKIIIIDNNNYRKMARLLFPDLEFKKYAKSLLI